MTAHGGTVAGTARRVSRISLRALQVAALCSIMVLGAVAQDSWALQRHSLLPERTRGHQTSGDAPTGPDAALREPAESADSGRQFQGPAPAPPGPAASSATAEAPSAEHAAKPSDEAAQAEAAHDAHEAHGVVLPEISPIPGVTFVETMIKLMDYELNGRFLGWRPNDIIIGRFTDNVNNYQLGVLEAIRFTTLRLKDSLTRMGDADTYDPDLELALNLFMNRATLFWFPSAENSYNCLLYTSPSPRDS